MINLPALLKHYESEYHYLFARTYRAVKGNDISKVELNYIFPNIARRLLETFLSFKRPETAGNLWASLQAIGSTPALLSIYAFVNRYSHGDRIDERAHDDSVLTETKPLLTEILNLIKDEDVGHYDAMERLTNKYPN
jgi:wobble nucleotide-excising tRNase